MRPLPDGPDSDVPEPWAVWPESRHCHEGPAARGTASTEQFGPARPLPPESLEDRSQAVPAPLGGREAAHCYLCLLRPGDSLVPRTRPLLGRRPPSLALHLSPCLCAPVSGRGTLVSKLRALRRRVSLTPHPGSLQFGRRRLQHGRLWFGRNYQKHPISSGLPQDCSCRGEPPAGTCRRRPGRHMACSPSPPWLQAAPAVGTQAPPDPVSGCQLGPERRARENGFLPAAGASAVHSLPSTGTSWREQAAGTASLPQASRGHPGGPCLSGGCSAASHVTRTHAGVRSSTTPRPREPLTTLRVTSIPVEPSPFPVTPPKSSHARSRLASCPSPHRRVPTPT